MATVVVKAGNFTAGETVNAYVQQKSGDYSTVPAVASGVAAADGSVSIGALTGKRAYKLIGQTSGNKIDGFADALRAPDGTSSAGVVLPNATWRAGANANAATAANRLDLCRFAPVADAILTKIGFEVVVVDPADPQCQFVVLDVAGKVLAITANQAGLLTVAGIKQLPLAPNLPVGVDTPIYAGIVTTGSVATLRGINLAQGNQSNALGTNMPEQWVGSIGAVAQPLAVGQNVGTALVALTSFPVISLRVD